MDKAHCASEEGGCSVKLKEEGEERKGRRRLSLHVGTSSYGEDATLDWQNTVCSRRVSEG